MSETYCQELVKMKEYLHKYMYQHQEKTGAISNSIHNMNVSFIHHIYFELLKEEKNKCFLDKNLI